MRRIGIVRAWSGTAASNGASTMVIEKTEFFGGTTAYSGGGPSAGSGPGVHRATTTKRGS